MCGRCELGALVVPVEGRVVLVVSPSRCPAVFLRLLCFMPSSLVVVGSMCSGSLLAVVVLHP